jgi:hypothetical protein
MLSRLARGTALALGVCASTLAAQQSSSLPAPDTTVAQAAPTSGYLPLTSGERWHDYLHSVAGPFAFVVPAVGAGLATLGNTPKFWPKTAGGFGQRYGTVFAANVADQTVKASFSAVLGEDNTYYPCSCHNVFARTGHAIVSTLVAVNGNGHLTPAFGSVAGAYAGGFTTMGLYGHNYGVDGGVRLGTTALAAHAVTNVVREFVGPLFSTPRQNGPGVGRASMSP